MKTVGIFEVKAKISEICETVKETQEPILITKRGEPMVRITPIENSKEKSNIWNRRKKFLRNNGLFNEDIILPSREVDLIINPLDN
ncbi:MAG: type II toxin-antitoxin system Phd/YefM family antitoxin [Spirochaetaceae bacterium]|nr:type II toxin-antitoxin system Phd/YefM family antitoxin [Spirochaetaceae bacterium]